MSNRFAWDDDDEFEFNEEQDRKEAGKNFRKTKEFKKRERRDATWSHERATRENVKPK